MGNVDACGEEYCCLRVELDRSLCSGTLSGIVDLELDGGLFG